MFPVFQEGNGQNKLNSSLSLDLRLRRSTRATPRPTRSLLISRLGIGRHEILVDFLWRSSFQEAVRPVLIIPDDKVRKLTPHRIKIQRNEDLPGALILHTLIKALDYGNATELPDGSISWADITFLAPSLECIAKEDGIFVHDEMPR